MNVRVEPEADQKILRANQTLKCSADGHPAPTYQWIDNISGESSDSRTHTLKPGEYNLTCVATVNECSLDPPICKDTDSLFSKAPETEETNFPYNLEEFKNVKPERTLGTCEENKTVAGHAVCMYTSCFRAL